MRFSVYAVLVVLVAALPASAADPPESSPVSTDTALWERQLRDRALRSEILAAERELWEVLEHDSPAEVAVSLPKASKGRAPTRPLRIPELLPMRDPAERESARHAAIEGNRRQAAARAGWLLLGGATLEAIGDIAGANERYRAATALTPENPQVWARLANTLDNPAERHAALLSANLLGPMGPVAEAASPGRAPREGPVAVERTNEAIARLAEDAASIFDESVEFSPKTTAYATAALALALALLLRNLLRQRGDLSLFLDYPPELRGTFRVRLHTSARRAERATRESDQEVLKGGMATNREHSLISRETRFNNLAVRRYHLVVDGVLQDPCTDEVLDHPFQTAVVDVLRRRTVRLQVNAAPESCPVDVNVRWNDEPVRSALVAALGDPQPPSPTSDGRVRLRLPKGEHWIVAGSSDRVAEQRVSVRSHLPTEVEIELNGPGACFKACPPAVHPYLRGDFEAAAAALESDGQLANAHRMRARMHRGSGDLAAAAEHFAAAGEWIEAAEIHAERADHLPAAEFFEKAGEWNSAAETYELGGDPVRAGKAYEAARDFDRAIDCYRRAGDTGRWLSVLERRGETYEAGQIALQAGLRPRGIRLLQRVAPDDPNFADACAQLARVFAKEHHWDLAAKKLAEHIEARRPAVVESGLYAELADYHERSGQLEDALHVLERLRAHDPSYPEVGARIEALRKARSEKRVSELQQAGFAGDELSPTILLNQQRYEILEELGRGGMGIVYRARDRRLGRVVALKRLSESLRDHPTAVQLFFREARAVASLNHPNIVTLYDADQEAGHLFFTMELLEGNPLAAILKKRKRIGARDLSRLGIQVCAGLDYAHQRNVVHRDIKTANLFLTSDRIIKIMDFGLAKVVEQIRRSTSVVGGTPYYMAPEQVLGEAIDQRADLYALGVTLFELATGRVPFPEGDAAYHNRHTEPPDPRSIVHDLPTELAELILGMLQKDREARPASAAEVAERLEAGLESLGRN